MSRKVKKKQHVSMYSVLHVRMLLLHVVNGYDHVMASGRDAMVVAMDTVCGTLQVKLHTKVLSSGCSLCVLFGLHLLTPLEFQCLTRKASARTGK